MRIIILFLLSVTTAACSVAQSGSRDGRGISRTSSIDEERVETLVQIGYYYIGSKPDSSLLLGKEAYALSSKTDNERGRASSLSLIGVALNAMGNHPAALKALLDALEVNEAINDQGGLLNCLNNIGGIYSDQGDYINAIAYYTMAKAKGEKLGNDSVVALAALNLGDAYEKINRFDSARVQTQEAYELSLRTHYEAVTGTALNNLGNIHLKTDNYRLAQAYYNSAIPYFQKFEDDDGVCEAMLGIAKIFDKAGEADSAIRYARKTLSIATVANFTKRIADASALLSSLFERKGKADSALAYMKLNQKANEELFSIEKVREVQNLSFGEKIRQQESEEAREMATEERKHKLQLLAIASFIVTFVMFVLIFSRKKTKPKTVEFFGVVGLLLVFEFISLLIHPVIEKITHHNLIMMLLILVAIASVLVPFHHKLEKWIKEKLAHKLEEVRTPLPVEVVEESGAAVEEEVV